jgi:hypothetical protein
MSRWRLILSDRLGENDLRDRALLQGNASVICHAIYSAVGRVCYIDPNELSLFLLREDVMFQVRSRRRRLNMQPAYLLWSLPGGDSDQGRQRNRGRLRQGIEE